MSGNNQNEPLREWSMNSWNDWAYWTQSMRRIVITFIIVGLLPTFIICGWCNAQLEAYEVSTNNSISALCSKDEGWGYYCRDCKKYYSLRKNSMFHSSHKHLKCWITAIYHFTLNTPKLADSIERDTKDDDGWCVRRCYPIITYLRCCVARFYNDNFPILGSNGNRVQIDEAAHSKKHKFNVGVYYPIRWVFGIIEENTNWCKFWHVPNRTAATLLPLIQAYVQPGAEMASDWWLAYQPLSSLGFVHFRVNHSYEFRDRLTEASTNLIECSWKWTKKSTISAGGCLDQHLQLKLDCHAFRKMWIQGNEQNGFKTICHAISQTHAYYKVSDFS